MINVKAYCKAAFLIFKYSALVSLQHQGKRYTKLKPTKIDTKVSYSKGTTNISYIPQRISSIINHHIWPIFFHEFHCSIFIYYSDCSYTFQLNQALPQK